MTKEAEADTGTWSGWAIALDGCVLAELAEWMEPKEMDAEEEEPLESLSAPFIEI